MYYDDNPETVSVESRAAGTLIYLDQVGILGLVVMDIRRAR